MGSFCADTTQSMKLNVETRCLACVCAKNFYSGGW